MARTIAITDDLDGSPGATERRFSVGNIRYVIDLNDENYAAFLAAIDVWRSMARPERKGGVKMDKEQLALLREWAAKEGKPVNARGRVPHSIIQEYFESIRSDAPSP